MAFSMFQATEDHIMPTKQETFMFALDASPVCIRESSIRESIERWEEDRLSPLATRVRQSRGRKVLELPCPIRTEFQRDRDRILHSKAFRRLKGKTQVFISPTGDHYRTRLTHTLEVSQIARTVARALRLNEDLTEAIALGHDLGHPPFGHAGESVLNEISSEGFRHTDHSVRIATVLEPLNLTFEVLDGMAQQAVGGKPQTLEAQVVEITDRMAYLHHDVEDAVRAGLIAEADIPKALQTQLGATRGQRLDTMVYDLIAQSAKAMAEGNPKIQMSSDVFEAMMGLRKWMFDHVYFAPPQLAQNQKIRQVITALMEEYRKNPKTIGIYMETAPFTEAPLDRWVIDYIAGMTDRFAHEAYLQRLMPAPFEGRHSGYKSHTVGLGSSLPADGDYDGSLSFYPMYADDAGV